MNRKPFGQSLPIVLLVFVLMGGLAACGQDESAPRAWIDWPRDGASVAVGSPVSVISHAYAQEGVAEVLLSVDGQPYRRDGPAEMGATFVKVTQEWRPEREGIYTLQVRTYASDGEASSPATVSVEVGDVLVPESVAAALTSPTPTFTPLVPMPVTPTPTFTPLVPKPITPTPLTPTPITPTPMTPTPITPTPITPTPITVTPVTPPPSGDVRLWVDDEQVEAGRCTTVYWYASSINAYWVDGQAGAGDEGSFRTCPCVEETHTLRASMRDGSEQTLSVTIRVSGQCQQAPPPPQDTNQDTSVAAPSPYLPHEGEEVPCGQFATVGWLPVDDPSGISNYHVRLERRAGGNWQAAGDWGSLIGKQLGVPVECGGRYRWSIRCLDGAGNVSEWSSWSEFSVAGQAPPQPPQDTEVAEPAPYLPYAGEDLSCRATVTLAWLPLDDPSGIAGYDVRLQRRENGQWRPAGEWGSINDKQIQIPVECNYEYRWSLRARDGAGNVSGWSSWARFNVTMM